MWHFTIDGLRFQNCGLSCKGSSGMMSKAHSCRLGPHHQGYDSEL